MSRGREITRAAGIVAKRMGEQSDQSLRTWHSTQGKRSVESLVQEEPLLQDFADRLVVIPDRHTSSFLLRRDLNRVASVCRAAQAVAKQQNFYACMHDSFESRTLPVMDADCKRVQIKAIEKVRPCLQKLVCLCADGPGNALFEFVNRVKRSFKMIFMRKQKEAMRTQVSISHSWQAVLFP